MLWSDIILHMLKYAVYKEYLKVRKIINTRLPGAVPHQIGLFLFFVLVGVVGIYDYKRATFQNCLEKFVLPMFVAMGHIFKLWQELHYVTLSVGWLVCQKNLKTN